MKTFYLSFIALVLVSNGHGSDFSIDPQREDANLQKEQTRDIQFREDQNLQQEKSRTFEMDPQ